MFGRLRPRLLYPIPGAAEAGRRRHEAVRVVLSGLDLRLDVAHRRQPRQPRGRSLLILALRRRRAGRRRPREASRGRR